MSLDVEAFFPIARVTAFKVEAKLERTQNGQEPKVACPVVCVLRVWGVDDGWLGAEGCVSPCTCKVMR